MKKIILAFVMFFALTSLIEIERNNTLDTAQFVGIVYPTDTNISVKGKINFEDDIDFFKIWINVSTIVKISVVTGGVSFPLIVGPEPEGGATFLPIVTVYNQKGHVVFSIAAKPGALFIPVFPIPVDHEFIYISISSGGEVLPPFISSDMPDVYIFKIFQ